MMGRTRSLAPMYVYIFGTASRLFWNYFCLIALITLLVWVPIELASAYMDAFVFDPEDVMRSLKFYYFLDGFVGIIATGSTLALVDAAFLGRPLGFGGALSGGLNAWGRVWWTRFLSGLLMIVGLLLLILPGIYLFIRLSLVDAIAVCERTSGGAAIQRSFELTKGRFWSLAGLALVVTVALVLMAVVFNLPLLLVEDEDVPWWVHACLGVVLDVLFAYVVVLAFTTYQWLVNVQAGAPALPLQNVETTKEGWGQ